MGVVHVPHLKAGPFAGKPPGAESAQAALVGQLGQGIGLVHELRKLAGTEKFLDRGDNRPDIDQSLGGDRFDVLDGHPLAHHPFHTGEADAELVLQQLAYAAQAAVTQVVDIIRSAKAIHQIQEVAHRGHDILRHEVLDVGVDRAVANHRDSAIP